MAITAMTPGADVPAPEPIGRRYGLFDAASGPLDLPRQGEGGGVRFVPVGCGEAFAYGVACYTSSDEPADKPLDGDNPLVETGVFAAVSTLLCSAVGYSLGEMQAKIRRRLEGGEQAAVEAALWTGLNMDGDDLGTPSLSGEAEAVQTGYNPELITDVLGALERYAYTTQQYGGRAYIHAPVEVAAFAAEAGLVLPEGPRKVTPMGSIWVFGAYPSGEVIVTGQTTVWRAPSIEVYDSFENATNQRLLVAERAYSVAFECFAGRAEFDPLEVTSP
jgi:hypothetical protein